MTERSEYVFEPYVKARNSRFTVLGSAGTLRDFWQSLRPQSNPCPRVCGLEHEYSLAAELEPEWATKPLALTRHEGRTILILAEPGGGHLDRVLERKREQPLDLERFLRVAINLAVALSHTHHCGLIHTDINPERARRRG